ncbi:alpha-N-arabinofuranosidase 1 [Enterococcus canis]|uniref:non-reducing end alpha-L-arabinofuranosidase n=1 Tax=Enterococcus canis TaxID=214095 RepID=A0A1L8RJK6_9ENTE|nr:alpha-L-arabinofuranosidase C-terminal domain-containing protein [Enterococcus canis]OJG19949.1 alpha-N-arabinofuranosidase 1 [Enterococcus canis]
MNTNITISKHFIKGDISPRLFGSFVEHMGSVVYTGIFEPGHPQADNRGFRLDVLEKVQALNLGVIRYPGGNFTSGYNWLDTIGSTDERPRKIDLAWRGIEPNTFGLNEFFEWLKEINAEPIMTINLGTKGIDDARNIVEYCNFPGGTYWSDLRISHGVKEPHSVKLWCLGNELDGPWQIGAKSAYEYGRLANEAAKVMKWTDDTIETVLVGSSTPRLESYPEWDRIALEQAYDNVDYLALHNYIDKYDEDDLTRPPKNERDDTPTYLAKSHRFDRQIEEIIATCDYVKGYVRSDKTMYLAFDEWNVHNQPQKEHHDFEIGSPVDWCYFTMEDTLLFGSLGLSILRHADRVKIACQSLLVNTIPLILTDANGASWVNPTYYVMQHLSKYAKGHVLQQNVVGPTYNVEKMQNVSYLDTCITESTDEIVIFCVNRSEEKQVMQVETDFELLKVIEHIEISHQDLQAKNTRETPNQIVPKQIYDSIEMQLTSCHAYLAPYSWNMIRVQKG